MADGEEDTGGAGVGAGGELVSPDSGMTTIRSSRSSKESSVFLSDDSPVGEVIAGGGPAAGPGGLFLRNPSPLGLLSLSPPVPPERRKHRPSRNKSDNVDLFSFDPLHSSDHSMPTGGELASAGIRADGEKRAESSSFSELEELSLLDFSGPNSLGGFESRDSSIDNHGQIHGKYMIDTVVPPTPVNSVVGSRPPSSCGVRFFPEDVVERINGLQHKDSVSSSLSETWDDLGFDTQGASTSSDNIVWNRIKGSESPLNILEDVSGKESVDDMTGEEGREETIQSEKVHQKGKVLEPQLSLITEQAESYDNWNLDSALKDEWNPVSLACLQLTPPEEDVAGKWRAAIIGVKEKVSSMSRKKAILNTLTPDTSKEEDEGVQGKKGDRKMEILDFWTYSAQKGFLKSDSGTTTSYPESLDMWNMTIRDDSLSPLTTPDNLSETSGSFCRTNSNVGAGTSVESPLGYSEGGMVMWNTTIREDSSSTITSPEGAENQKDLSHTGSLDGGDSPGTHASKQVEEEKTIEEESGIHKVLSETVDEVRWRGNEHNVKIVIEAAESETMGEETGDDDNQNLVSDHSEDGTSSYQGTDMWDLPVPGMVTSTSEYDNVGAGTWSLTSSPDAYASPIVDMVQLEGQSSPFVAVTQPMSDPLGKTEYRTVISDEEQPANQVFLFEGTSELGHMITSGRSSVGSKNDNKSRGGSEETDWIEQHSDHSPFVLVDTSTVIQDTSASLHSCPGEDAKTQIQTDQSLSPGLVDWDHFVSKKHDSSESTSSSHDLPVTTAYNDDGLATKSQGGLNNESIGKEFKTTETMSLSSSSGGERDAMKYSPDGLLPGSRDELRSNSDGDSSSGLEMDYIIVSGTVKEAEREWCDRPKHGNRQSKGTRRSMETFSMLSYAATVLQSQAQASQREQQGNAEQSRQNQMIRSTDSPLSTDTEKDPAVLSTHYQASLDHATEHCMVPEMITPSQSTINSEAPRLSDSRPTSCSQTQAEDGNDDDKSSIVARSMSPSLRYPSDHFLKTREEVYVHSQISMEDSDEGGQSPSAPPPCPTSLGKFKVWRGQDTPRTTSEPQSPVCTNSSVSQSSSFIWTPLSESGISTDRGLGLPFSGDLMEEENDEEEQRETDTEHSDIPKWSETEERQQLGSSDLLSFTEELTGGFSSQQTHLKTVEPKRDRFLPSTLDYYDEQPGRTDDRDKWSTQQQIGDHAASRDSYSPVLR